MPYSQELVNNYEQSMSFLHSPFSSHLVQIFVSGSCFLLPFAFIPMGLGIDFNNNSLYYLHITCVCYIYNCIIYRI